MVKQNILRTLCCDLLFVTSCKRHKKKFRLHFSSVGNCLDRPRKNITMNNYFSSSARQKRKSKSQLHIGAKSSLSLFHGGNELKQDFLQRETHSSRRDRHVNGFIEACIGTVRVDFQGEASIQQHKKAPQCLQSDSLKINQ